MSTHAHQGKGVDGSPGFEISEIYWLFQRLLYRKLYTTEHNSWCTRPTIITMSTIQVKTTTMSAWLSEIGPDVSKLLNYPYLVIRIYNSYNYKN